MSLYSELGIRDGASREEIRAAYLRLAKETHPDRFQDESERTAAEQQMSRLNRIMETLGDDELRRQYDEELAAIRAAADLRFQQALAMQAREALPWARLPERHWFGWTARTWAAGMLLLLTGLGGLLWLLITWDAPQGRFRAASTQQVTSAAELETPPAHRPGRSLIRGFSRRPPPPSSPPKASHPAGRRSLTSAADTPEDPLVEEARAALRTPPRSNESAPVPPRPVLSPSAMEHPPALVVPKPSTPPPAPPVPKWSGHWRYSPSLAGPASGDFSPLAIDMQLLESGGRTRGTYRARYQVASHKDTGDVTLELDAVSFGRDWMRGVWSGNGGAHGQFEVKKMSDGNVQMSWWTTKFGDRDALASGSARLVESAQ